MLRLGLLCTVVGIVATVGEEETGYSKDGMFLTPIGWRPSECIHHSTEEKVRITPKDNGVEAYYPDSDRTEFHPALSHCVDNAKELLAHRRKQRLNPESQLKDGWVIFSQAALGVDMGVFQSTYHIPNQNLPMTGQLLYYFIGFTDFDPNNETILQPVIAFCGSSGGCGYSYYTGGWMAASWNCCPSGQSWYGNGVEIVAGEKVTNWIAATPSTGKAQVAMAGQNGQSYLEVGGDYRHFNYAEVALEMYTYSSCGQFNTDPFIFSDMSMTDQYGRSVTPNWQITNNDPLNCGGSLKFNGAFYAEIVG